MDTCIYPILLSFNLRKRIKTVSHLYIYIIIINWYLALHNQLLIKHFCNKKTPLNMYQCNLYIYIFNSNFTSCIGRF